MSLSKYERGGVFKTSTAWTSGTANTAVDPSGNRSFISIYNPDGNLIIDTSSQRDSTGIYSYWISSSAEYDLGIYVAKHWGRFWYNPPQGYLVKINREPFQLCHVKQD